MSTTKQELQELNKKFDTLISLMIQQQQKPSTECKEVVEGPVDEPLKKKRGRPKKLPDFEPKENSPVVEKKVKLYVTPIMNIAGEDYGGNVEVTEGIATQLRNMMQRWKAYEDRVNKYIDHGVKDHGVM